jgi:hypothetical protein
MAEAMKTAAIVSSLGIVLLVGMCSLAGSNHSTGAGTSLDAFDRDWRQAEAIGAGLKEKGLIVGYSVSSHELNLNISSMLPGDARTYADTICGHEFQSRLPDFHWDREHPWTLHVFLIVGDRPAAECTL